MVRSLLFCVTGTLCLISLAGRTAADMVNESFEDTPDHLNGWTTGGLGWDTFSPGRDGGWYAGKTIPLATSGTTELYQTFTMPAGATIFSVDVVFLGGEGGGNSRTATLQLAGQPASAIDLFSRTITPLSGAWDRYSVNASAFAGQSCDVYFAITATDTASMTLWVDNVGRPEPATMTALALGVAALLRSRRYRQPRRYAVSARTGPVRGRRRPAGRIRGGRAARSIQLAVCATGTVVASLFLQAGRREQPEQLACSRHHLHGCRGAVTAADIAGVPLP